LERNIAETDRLHDVDVGLSVLTKYFLLIVLGDNHKENGIKHEETCQERDEEDDCKDLVNL